MSPKSTATGSRAPPSAARSGALGDRSRDARREEPLERSPHLAGATRLLCRTGTIDHHSGQAAERLQCARFVFTERIGARDGVGVEHAEDLAAGSKQRDADRAPAPAAA